MILLLRLVLLPLRIAFGFTGFSFRLGYRTGSLLGYRRMLVLGLGVGIGLLLAPVPGRELRARLRERLEGGPLPASDDQPFVGPGPRDGDVVAVAGTPARA